jgi:hypothetical protein
MSMSKGRIPKVILKSVYESFRRDDETSIKAKAKLLGPTVDAADALSLGKVARVCPTFEEFDDLIHFDSEWGMKKLSDSQMAVLAGGGISTDELTASARFANLVVGGAGFKAASKFPFQKASAATAVKQEAVAPAGAKPGAVKAGGK